MSARDPYAFKLGLFVVTGLVVLLGGLFAFGFSTVFERKLPLYCYFQENVQGLEPGSEIKYRGVLVGRVRTVELVTTSAMSRTAKPLIRVKAEFYPAKFGNFGDDWMITEAELSEQLRVASGQGMRVRLAWKDITGQKYLDVDYHAEQDDVIPKLPFAPEEPYLPTAIEAGLDDIQRDLATTLANVAKFDFESISDGLTNLLELANQSLEGLDTAALSEETTATLRDVREFVGNEDMKRAMARMDEIAANLEETTQNANALLTKEELGTAIEDFAVTAKSMRALSADLEKRLPGVLDGVEGTMADAREVMGESRIPETTESLRQAADGVGSASRGVAAMREDLRRAVKEFAAAARSIGRLARLLEENPQALLSGKGPGGRE